MSLSNYDKALLNKLKSWFKNVVYSNTAITYNTVYNLMEETQNTKMEFPLINLYRIDYQRNEQQNFLARKQGQQLWDTQNTQSLITVMGRYLEFDLLYQLDFYAKSSEELDDLIMQVMQAMELLPQLNVEHKDNKTNETFIETYYIVFKSGPVEQSEFDNNDRVYRKYIQYGIDKTKQYNMADQIKVNIVDTQINAHESEQKIVFTHPKTKVGEE